jgi:hypothetical protein
VEYIQYRTDCDISSVLQLTVLAQFAEYQEQSYLLDPFLEDLVAPVIKKFKFYARSLADGDVNLEDIATFTPNLLSAPLTRVSYLLYNYFKFRGYKTISQSIRASRSNTRQT